MILLPLLFLSNILVPGADKARRPRLYLGLGNGLARHLVYLFGSGINLGRGGARHCFGRRLWIRLGLEYCAYAVIDIFLGL